MAKSYTPETMREHNKVYIILDSYRNSDTRNNLKSLDNHNTPCKNWNMNNGRSILRMVAVEIMPLKDLELF